MARDLAKCDNNKLTLRDALSGGEIVFYYRTPTTTERIKFQKSQFVRSGGKIFARIHEARLSRGLEILTGIREGDFSVAGEPLSSTPGEEGYREDWKDLIAETAGDLVMILGQQIFEGSLPVAATKEFLGTLHDESDDGMEDGEPAVPLE